MPETEEKRSLSHFAGLIRLVIFVIILVLLAFLLVRWAQNRQVDRRAKDAAENTSQAISDEQAENSNPPSNGNTARPQPSTTPSSNNPGNQTTNNPIPSTAGGTAELPSTGIGSSLVLTAAFIGATIYLLGKNFSYHKEIRSQT